MDKLPTSDQVINCIKNKLPEKRTDAINLSYRLTNSLVLEIHGTRHNCYILLQQTSGNKKTRVGTCGVTYRPDSRQGEIPVYAHTFHCPQEIHETLRGLGLMTLMQSVRDAICGRLDFETSERSDLMTCYIKRGYLPIGYFDKSARASWTSEIDMHPMDSKTYMKLAAFLRKQNEGQRDVEYFPQLIRFGYSPFETLDLYQYITGGKGGFNDRYLKELRESEASTTLIFK